jgi:hypothetical protein
MCWGKLPSPPGRADAWPFCGPWPRPHLAAAKLVELRSSVDLVAMPHQPLDRYIPEPINPALRRVATQRSWNWAILGSPRCGGRGESQRAGDTNPGNLGVASSGSNFGQKGADYFSKSAKIVGEFTRTDPPIPRCDGALAAHPVVNWGFERRTGSDGRGSTAPGCVFALLR